MLSDLLSNLGNVDPIIKQCLRIKAIWIKLNIWILKHKYFWWKEKLPRLHPTTPLYWLETCYHQQISWSLVGFQLLQIVTIYTNDSSPLFWDLLCSSLWHPRKWIVLILFLLYCTLGFPFKFGYFLFQRVIKHYLKFWIFAALFKENRILVAATEILLTNTWNPRNIFCSCYKDPWTS